MSCTSLVRLPLHLIAGLLVRAGDPGGRLCLAAGGHEVFFIIAVVLGLLAGLQGCDGLLGERGRSCAGRLRRRRGRRLQRRRGRRNSPSWRYIRRRVFRRNTSVRAGWEILARAGRLAQRSLRGRTAAGARGQSCRCHRDANGESPSHRCVLNVSQPRNRRGSRQAPAGAVLLHSDEPAFDVWQRLLALGGEQGFYGAYAKPDWYGSVNQETDPHNKQKYGNS